MHGVLDFTTATLENPRSQVGKSAIDDRILKTPHKSYIAQRGHKRAYQIRSKRHQSEQKDGNEERHVVLRDSINSQSGED